MVIQRRQAKSRWADFVWEPVGVVPGEHGGEVQPLVQHETLAPWLHPGFSLELHRDEAEGYFENVSTDHPRVFVLWRMEDERALPLFVTASLAEASRWMDGGHTVDGVPMPAEIYAWVGAYVEANYRPEPKKRIKPSSFRHPRDRV